MLAQLDLNNGFSNVKGVDILEKNGHKITMDYGRSSGNVDGEKVTIISADCDPYKRETHIVYQSTDKRLYQLIFFFNEKGKFVDFSLVFQQL